MTYSMNYNLKFQYNIILCVVRVYTDKSFFFGNVYCVFVCENVLHLKRS